MSYMPESSEGKVWLRVTPRRIDYINKIIEGYDNLAMVSTVDPAQGVLVCHVTPDMRPVLLKLLSKLRVELLDGPDVEVIGNSE